MKITFEIEFDNDGYHEDEYDSLHPEDRIELTRSALADGFCVPEECIKIISME